VDDTVVNEHNGSVAQPARRLFRIADVLWTVYEVPDAALVFESESVVRRVTIYPPDWRTFADADLYALSWSK
jgi:hypothetical protein